MLKIVPTSYICPLLLEKNRHNRSKKLLKNVMNVLKWRLGLFLALRLPEHEGQRRFPQDIFGCCLVSVASCRCPPIQQFTCSFILPFVHSFFDNISFPKIRLLNRKQLLETPTRITKDGRGSLKTWYIRKIDHLFYVQGPVPQWQTTKKRSQYARKAEKQSSRHTTK